MNQVRQSPEKYQFEVQFFESIYQKNPADSSVVELLAHLYTKLGRISDGLRMDRKMIRLQPENPTAHYNLACSLALKNRKSEAVKALRDAIAYEYSDWDWLLQDPDLETLHDYSPFQDLLAEYKVERSSIPHLK